MLLIYGAGYRRPIRMLLARRPRIRGVQITYAQIGIIVGMSLALMLALYFFVHHTPRHRDARARNRSGRRAPDGHRRRTPDPAHLLLGSVLAAARGRHGRRSTTPRSISSWASCSACSAFTAAVLGGIGNIPGAMAGGILIGLLGVVRRGLRVVAMDTTCSSSAS